MTTKKGIDVETCHDVFYVVLIDEHGFVAQKGPSYNSYDRAELDARYRNQERDDSEYRWTVYDSWDFV